MVANGYIKFFMVHSASQGLNNSANKFVNWWEAKMEAEQKHKVTVEFNNFEWKMLQAACAYDGLAVEEFVKAHALSAVANALVDSGSELERKWAVTVNNPDDP
jgi:hypothetical protein